MTRVPAARESDNLGSRVARFTIAGLLLLVAVAWVALYLYAGDEAPRNASVEGISIAGLGADEAEQQLRDGLADRTEEPVGLTYGDGRGQSIDPAAAGPGRGLPASVEEAGGGSGFGPRRMWEVMTGGSDHHAEITVDQSKMQAVARRARRRDQDAAGRGHDHLPRRARGSGGEQGRRRRGARRRPGHPRAPVPARRLAEDPHRGEAARDLRRGGEPGDDRVRPGRRCRRR